MAMTQRDPEEARVGSTSLGSHSGSGFDVVPKASNRGYPISISHSTDGDTEAQGCRAIVQMHPAGEESLGLNPEPSHY